MSDLEKLLGNWEAIFMRGQLTFWVLLALLEGKKHAAEISNWVAVATNQTVETDMQNLYRALRRYYDAELVDYTTLSSQSGPDLKAYYLTTLGASLLYEFINRNVANFYHPLIKQVLGNEE